MVRHETRHQSGVESPGFLPARDSTCGVLIQLVLDFERWVEHENGARLPARHPSSVSSLPHQRKRSSNPPSSRKKARLRCWRRRRPETPHRHAEDRPTCGAISPIMVRLF